MVERKRFKPKPKKVQAYSGARRGPKSTYLPIYAKMAQALCARGATDADLATAFGKTTFTVQAWCSEYPEFGQAILHGKAAVFDPKVERALAQRALGYSVDTEEIKVIDGLVVRVPTRKHFPPDTTACIFWLKNRHPEAWRDVHRVEHTGSVTDGMTAAELLDQIRKDASELGILPEALIKKTVGVVPTNKGNGSTH